MHYRLLVLVAALAAFPSLAAETETLDRAEVEELLRGATLEGVYLRTGSAYSLEFKADGALVGADGEGRWWVNTAGQYCREWLSGRLKGNQACLDVVREGEAIALYSRGKRVAEGRLDRR